MAERAIKVSGMEVAVRKEKICKMKMNNSYFVLLHLSKQ